MENLNEIIHELMMKFISVFFFHPAWPVVLSCIHACNPLAFPENLGLIPRYISTMRTLEAVF